jgi:hypothetical protein
MSTLQELHQQSYADMPFDDFAKRYHQKFYADLPFDQFMSKAAPQKSREVIVEDPTKATVRRELDQMRASGAPVSNGIGRQVLQGMTFGAADEILAAASIPLEMIKRRTFSPVEGYNFAKAREDLLLEDARKRGGIGGTIAEVGGGLLTGGALAKGGVTLIDAGKGALANIPRIAAEGAIYGGITGAAEGEGMGRLTDAAKGAVIGGAAGGAVGVAAPVVSGLTRNLGGFISASRDPEGFAGRQLARALSESGRTPQQVAQEVADAAAIGQPFTVADALGNSGQRMLSTVARNPGEGRTAVVDFLDGRQATQGRRIANVLAEGLNAPKTAQQAEAAMRATRSADASVNYGAARGSGGAVDPSRAIAAADDFLQPGVTRLASPQTNISDDSVEAIVSKARSYLTDGNSVKTNFNAAFRAKREIDRMITKNPDVIELYPIRNALDDALAKASGPYSQARDTFRNQSKAIDAIAEGSAAARAGRFEDTTRRFAGMSPDEQAGFRVGYGDKLIESVQGGAMGQNKARPLSSDAYRNELDTLSLYQGPRRPGEGDQLAKALGRENTMFETRATALGGSKTADNLADNAAMGVNPEIIGNLLSGNFVTAGKNALLRSGDNLSGNTPAVREQLAKLLLQTGPQSQKQLENALQSVITNKQQRDQIVKALLSGGIGGAASGSSNVRQRN